MAVRRLAVLAALPLLAGLAACNGEKPAPVSTGSPSSAAPRGGTSAAPAPVPPTTDLMAWSPLPGSDGTTVTSNGTWRITVPDEGRGYTLTQGDDAHRVTVPKGRRVTDALLNDRWAVVAHEDRLEEQPQQAVAVELATGREVRVDGRSQVPTTIGGTWALDGDRLAYATLKGRDYCLAVLDLASGAATQGPCVGAREGFNNVHLSAAGDALLRFDLGRPSCRTVVSVQGTATTPFPGVAECHGAEGALLETPAGPGAIWSVVPDEQRFEEVHFYARSGEQWFDLGPGTNGTLVLCGGAAYFSRDAQTGDGTAALLRWDGSSLAVVYESKPGQAVLSEARCGGGALTVSSLAQGGDEQVTAPLTP